MQGAKTKLVLQSNHIIETKMEARSESKMKSNSKVNAIEIGIQSNKLIHDQLYENIQTISILYPKQGLKPQIVANQANLAQLNHRSNPILDELLNLLSGRNDSLGNPSHPSFRSSIPLMPPSLSKLRIIINT